MTRYWSAVLLAAQLLALAAFSEARDFEALPVFSEARDVQNATDHKPLLKPSDDPAKATTIVIGVVATTTLLVLVLLIPSMIYYKLQGPGEDETIPIKQLNE